MILSFYSQLIRTHLHGNFDQLAIYLISDQQVTENFSKVSMILKALTFNRGVLKANFKPYISETILKLLKLTKVMIEDLDLEKP